MSLLACMACCVLAAPAVHDEDTIRTQAVAEDWDLVLYKTRVKLVDEFFDRFNGKAGRIDVAADDSDCRRKNLLLLFDSQMFVSADDSLFAEAVSMVDTVISSGTAIEYPDSAWMARASCQARLNGKEVTLDLYLNVERRGEDMYKWVIARAEGDILKLSPSLRSGKMMLMPDDHETNFLSLYRVTTERDDCITNYASRCFTVDETSVFFAYVYSGQLDIDRVSSLEFTFLQVPGYAFTIKHVERDTYNAGWLISSFRRMTDADKQALMKTIYR